MDTGDLFLRFTRKGKHLGIDLILSITRLKTVLTLPMDSANYGLSSLNADLPAYLNSKFATYLDVRHPADNAIRRKMVKKWKMLRMS